MFSLCVTIRGMYHWVCNGIFYPNPRGRYHWVYNNRIFYPNPWCDQTHGPWLRFLQFVALRPGTARPKELVSLTSRCRPIRWGMLCPAHRRLKGKKALILVGSDWVCLRSARLMVVCSLGLISWRQIWPLPGRSHVKFVRNQDHRRRRQYYTYVGVLWKTWLQPNHPMRWCRTGNEMVWDGGSEPLVVPARRALLGVSLGGAPVWPCGGGGGFTEKSVGRRPPCYLPLAFMYNIRTELSFLQCSRPIVGQYRDCIEWSFLRCPRPVVGQ